MSFTFYCDNSGEDVQVGVRDVGILGLDRLQEFASDAQAGVASVVALRLEPHRRSIGTA